MRRTILVFGVVAVVIAMFAPPAFAAAPINDNFADATVIFSLPFSNTVNNTEAGSFLDLELDAGTYFLQIDGYVLQAGPWFLDVRVVDP